MAILPNQSQIDDQNPVKNNNLGTGYTNMSRILAANQSNQMGSAINSGMTNQTSKVKEGINTQVQDFNKQTEQNRWATDTAKGMVDSTLQAYQPSTPSSAKFDKMGNPIDNTSGIANTARTGTAYSNAMSAFQAQFPNEQITYNDQSTNPLWTDFYTKWQTDHPEQVQQQTLVNPDQSTLDNFKTYTSGQYNGPVAMKEQEVESLRQQALDAESLANMAQYSGGRQQLLQRFVGSGPEYNQGKQKLDELILGKTGNSDLHQIRRDTSGIGSLVTNADQSAKNIGQAYVNEADQFGLDTRSKLAKLLDSNTTGMADEAATARQSQDVYSQLLKQRLNAMASTSEDSKNEIAKLLGKTKTDYTPEEWNQLDAMTDRDWETSGIKKDSQEYKDLNLLSDIRKYTPNLNTGLILGNPGITGEGATSMRGIHIGKDMLREFVDATKLGQIKNGGEITYQPLVDKLRAAGYTGPMRVQLITGSTGGGNTTGSLFNNWGDLIKTNDQPTSNENLVSADTLAKMNALNQLSGKAPVYDTLKAQSDLTKLAPKTDFSDVLKALSSYGQNELTPFGENTHVYGHGVVSAGQRNDSQAW